MQYVCRPYTVVKKRRKRMTASLQLTFIFWWLLCFTIHARACYDGEPRAMMFVHDLDFAGKRLLQHVIGTFHVPDMRTCKWRCYCEPNCISFNFEMKANSEGKFKCELNNSTHLEHAQDISNEQNYFYRGVQNACGFPTPCQNGGTCQSGFSGKGYRCMCTGSTGEHCEHDIDECAAGIWNCDVKATCVNTRGSYNCKCHPGYAGDGKRCIDIDECATGIKTCDDNATCVNTEGSYNCTCNPGYTGDGNNCTDIDECEPGVRNCNDNATCVNTEGSYNCTCNPGFAGDWKNCTDIDECSLGDVKCEVNATCLNTKGSYNCKCNPGYTGDGNNCTDIDECAQYTYDCLRSPHAHCINTMGSFRCACNHEYVGDGKTKCEPKGCQSYQNLTDADRKTSYVTGVAIKDDKGLGPGWFRFEGAAGTKMPTSDPGGYRCNTESAGWLEGGHPHEGNKIVTKKVCFSATPQKQSCFKSTNIKVINCSTHFVYYFNGVPFVPSSYFRYCSTD